MLASTGLGLTLALGAAELALRARAGAGLELRDLRPQAYAFTPDGFARYDPLLGHVPKPCAAGTRRGGWSASSDPHGLRRNRAAADTTEIVGPPILAVGDSTTFGDEVDDHESWPAQLERRLRRRVLNAGMSGYGIDQAVLRAEQLLPRFGASIVLLSFVSDDVTRCAYEFRYRWRPYFSLEGEALVLTRPAAPEVPLREWPWLVAIGHSHAAAWFLSRAFPELWRRSTHRRVHRDEREVAGRLVARLHRFALEQGARLLIVPIAGASGNREHVPDQLRRARENGVPALDLTDELAGWASDPEARDRMFRPHLHLAPEANGWVAQRIAARLEELGWLELPASPRSGELPEAPGCEPEVSAPARPR